MSTSELYHLITYIALPNHIPKFLKRMLSQNLIQTPYPLHPTFTFFMALYSSFLCNLQFLCDFVRYFVGILDLFNKHGFRLCIWFLCLFYEFWHVSILIFDKGSRFRFFFVFVLIYFLEYVHLNQCLETAQGHGFSLGCDFMS